MTSNTTTGERRWASGRRGGMTVLGKVPVPKPINLPSQRSENHGLDPNVAIVPKGTHSWGSRSSTSTNAWSTSTLSPSTDGSSSSPGQLGLRPSSSGGTRPSTAGSEIARDPNNVNTWISNSRPLSASGSSPSVKVSLVSSRPRSAETRPGSSQLSRFAESSLESGAWGPGSTSEQGLGNPGKEGFSLSSGDFPTLGSEKVEPRKNTEPRDDIPRDADPKDSSYNGLQRCNEEPYPYQNPNIPPYYEPWHGAPSVNPTGPMWFSGPPPYGSPGPFQMDPFPYYLPQVRPNLAHSHGVPPHGHYASNGDMYRPHHMPESYMHPGMPVGPGFYPGPGPYDGYYGPSMGLCNPNDRDLPFMGRPTGPPVYSQAINSNVSDPKHSYFRPGEFGAHDPHENSMMLRKQRDDEKGILSKAPILDNTWEDNYKNDEDMHFEKNEKIHSRSIEHEVGSFIPTNVGDTDLTSFVDTVPSSEGHSLIQMIDCLTVKDRSPGVIRDGNEELDGIQVVDSKADRCANDASLNIAVPVVNATSRSDHGKEGDGWRKRSESHGIVSQAGSGSNVKNPLYPTKVSESNVGKGEKESGIRNDIQRAKMKEIAKQRALELQKEEEERIRDQKAKALAKLEELNRRSSANHTDENPSCKLDNVPSHSAPKNHTELRVGPTNHFTDTTLASPTNFEPKNEIRVAICEVKEVDESPNIPFSPVQKKNESETNKNKLQELPTTVTYDPNPNITEDNISDLNTKSSIQSKDVTHTSANHTVLSHEDAHTRQNILLKPQYSRKPRSLQGNRSEKSHNNNDTVVWAPVRPHSSIVEMIDRTDQKSVDERSWGDDVVDNCPKTKRAEIERYVPKHVDGNHKQRGQGSDETLVKGPKVIACDGWNGPNDSDFSLKGQRHSFKGHKGTYSDMNLERKGTKAGSNELPHSPTIETSKKETIMPLKESTPIGDRTMSQWKPKAQLSRHNQGAPRDPVTRENSHVDGGTSSLGHHENKIDKSIASVRGHNASSNRGFVGRFKKGPESQEDWNRPNAHVEYKPIVDSYNRSSDMPYEHGTQTENRFGGMKYRGTGQSQARGGRGSFYGKQRGTRADVGNE